MKVLFLIWHPLPWSYQRQHWKQSYWKPGGKNSNNNRALSLKRRVQAKSLIENGSGAEGAKDGLRGSFGPFSGTDGKYPDTSRRPWFLAGEVSGASTIGKSQGETEIPLTRQNGFPERANG
jgi:hypothetical protein